MTEPPSGFPSGKHNNDGIGVPHLRPMNVDRLGRIDLTQLKYVEPTRDLFLEPGDVLFRQYEQDEHPPNHAAIAA